MDVNAAQLEQEAIAGMSDIPPVICCARCGLGTCDGCATPAVPAALHTRPGLPWVTHSPSLGRLFDTALSTSREAGFVFAGLLGTAPARALFFALSVELLALGSILVVAALAFFTWAPRPTAALLRQGTTWLTCGGLWVLTSLLVVVLHVLWAALLERGVVRFGGERRRGLLLEFAGYSCGWDLLTSPWGVWLNRRGRAGGASQAAGRGRNAILLAVRAPRPAMQAYLRECRGLGEEAAGAVMRRASREAVALVAILACAAVGGVIGVLAATWPH